MKDNGTQHLRLEVRAPCNSVCVCSKHTYQQDATRQRVIIIPDQACFYFDPGSKVFEHWALVTYWIYFPFCSTPA